MPVKNLKQRKTEIRSKHKKIRANLTLEKKQQLDRELAENFLNSPYYINADRVFAFVSKDIEVDTSIIIKDALSKGKQVCVPCCNVQDTLMDYYYISSYDDLICGAYGILEPDTRKCHKVDDLSSGICIVPGLVYDREGYRLGFGKGYYDRFLTDFSGITIGVCYSRCIEQQLPRGYYDKPVDVVVTEKYVIDTVKY